MTWLEMYDTEIPERWKGPISLAEYARHLQRCLGLLMDIQNGPPLIKYKDEWEEAMAEGRELLQL